MALIRLEPATMAYTGDQVPYSERYGDVYHSRDGGPEQCRQVFLAGNRLPARWQQRERFVVLETGFGLGLNFLVTWAAWRADPARCGRLHYVSLEKHPFVAADLAQLHRQWPELAGLSQQLCDAWPCLTPGIHRLVFDEGRVVLTLVFDDVQAGLKNLSAVADAIYLDGFAPDRNPDMWSTPVFRGLARCAHQGTTLATYSVAAALREGLSAAGFIVAKQAGFGRKKAMLAGEFRVARPTPAVSPSSALVIGAGLAGCSIAERLASRGIQVNLLESLPEVASATSGNWAGCFLPLPSADDNLTSRFTRHGFLALGRQLRELQLRGADVCWSPCGVLQIGKDSEAEQAQRDILAQLGSPAEFATYLDRQQAMERAGVELDGGGWWFGLGGWARPASVCQALLQVAGTSVRLFPGRQVARLLRHESGWQALDADDDVIAAADIVVLANAADAANLWPQMDWPLELIRGQINYLPQGSLPDFAPVLCREGYVLPAVAGQHVVGASYDFRNSSPAISDDSTQGNRRRLERILPGRWPAESFGQIAGRVGFRCVSADRLPLVGSLPDVAAAPGAGMQLKQLPRQDGLYCLLALGSRGLVWAGAAAESLASRINGDPDCLELDIVEAMDPARFWLRELRH